MTVQYEKFNEDFKKTYQLMEKQFDPKRWVHRDSYDLKSSFYMCNYIIGNFYSRKDFPCPKELLTHCFYLFPFVQFL